MGLMQLGNHPSSLVRLRKTRDELDSVGPGFKVKSRPFLFMTLVQVNYVELG